MIGFCLIDLYVRHEPGRLEELSSSAKRAGLDAIVIIFDDPSELPEAVQWRELTQGLHGAKLLAGIAFHLQDLRFVVLGEALSDPTFTGALEALVDAEAVIDLAAKHGCVAMPVCHRQRPSGGLNRDEPLSSFPSATGVVTEVVGGSILGRDLEVEDAAASGRRMLGATGPFGTAEDVGRFATLLPLSDPSSAAVASAIGSGKGVAVELAKDATVSSKKRRRRKRSRSARSRRGPRQAEET